MSAPIYLDHAATTPLDPAVLEAMLPYLKNQYANPSSLYTAARETRRAVETARAQIAGVLGAKTTEIVFTSGGTEGNNLAIQGVLRAHPGAHWAASAIEHDAVLAAAEPLAAEGHEFTAVPVKPGGIVSPEAVTSAITDQTVLVSIMLANNEIGTIQPIADIAKLVAEVRTQRAKRGITLPLYLHTDAVQAANYLDLHVVRLGVDLLTLNGSKIYGPKGSGALYIRHSTVLSPLMFGGGQERGRRSGTENVAGIVGLAAALVQASARREAEARRLTPLRDHLIEGVVAAVPDAVLNGDPKRRLPNNVNFTLPGAEGEALVLYLDNAGVMASTGSACSTGSLDPSHVLLAIGRTAAEANSSLRLTLGRATTAADIEAVIKHLPPIVQRLREL
ncbi:MAG TPA: cysteine desulfurase family protein [Candidatus Saccharimonadia bacterium]|jgi:cysteine desulfurase|nr:cysteine desulfurase family protein [Candidatus Saccharimonadia bacterium]